MLGGFISQVSNATVVFVARQGLCVADFVESIKRRSTQEVRRQRRHLVPWDLLNQIDDTFRFFHDPQLAGRCCAAWHSNNWMIRSAQRTEVFGLQQAPPNA